MTINSRAALEAIMKPMPWHEDLIDAVAMRVVAYGYPIENIGLYDIHPSDAAEARDTAAMIVAIMIKALVCEPVSDDIVLMRLHDLSAHALDQMSRDMPPVPGAYNPAAHKPKPPAKDTA